jgi:hypothetical protein
MLEGADTLRKLKPESPVVEVMLPLAFTVPLTK